MTDTVRTSVLSRFRVVTAQGEQGIWIIIFQTVKTRRIYQKELKCVYTGNLPPIQGKFWSFRNKKKYLGYGRSLAFVTIFKFGNIPFGSIAFVIAV